jgi:hypothetical protein
VKIHPKGIVAVKIKDFDELPKAEPIRLNHGFSDRATGRSLRLFVSSDALLYQLRRLPIVIHPS